MHFPGKIYKNMLYVEFLHGSELPVAVMNINILKIFPNQRVYKTCVISGKSSVNMLQVLSYQIADNIDIKMFKGAFKADLYYNDADELFYQTDTEQFIYIFKYGVVCFLNYDAIKITEYLRFISTYCKNAFEESLSEAFQIQTNSKENKIGYTRLRLHIQI